MAVLLKGEDILDPGIYLFRYKSLGYIWFESKTWQQDLASDLEKLLPMKVTNLEASTYVPGQPWQYTNIIFEVEKPLSTIAPMLTDEMKDWAKTIGNIMKGHMTGIGALTFDSAYALESAEEATKVIGESVGSKLLRYAKIGIGAFVLISVLKYMRGD
jgi:hypothetical protein